MRILTDAIQGIDINSPFLPDGVKLAVSYLRVSTSAQAETDYDEEGYSIPAQREANQRTADRLGAVIVAEFIDRGESAKTADRPELQLMLQFLREMMNISYVIVHKVDRLARSREDDVAINIAIRHTGAQLVSSTENIDDTPSGKLLHGIMATIAEFYSSNLAMEAKKGMRQKARMGGTPGLAPLGYLNIRERIDGREIRTVTVDPDRAPLIQWMFEAYASGTWTMSQLRDELDRRGLRIPATAKRPARPVTIQHIDKMLMNRYYLGYVKFEGVWYEGRHTALIDQDTFDQVQAVRIARAMAREKTQKHPHYLKGSIYCGRCGSWMGISNVKNRWGTIYPYFYCLGRAKRKNCTQSAVLIADVEASVADWWVRVHLTEAQATGIREHVAGSLARQQARNQAELERQQKRVRQLENQRLKLLEARYADAIPLDLFKTEQKRITDELTNARKIIERCQVEADAVMRMVDEVLLLCADAHRLYLSAPGNIRRQLNQAVFTRFWIIDEEIGGADLTEPFVQLLVPDLAKRLHAEDYAKASLDPQNRPTAAPTGDTGPRTRNEQQSQPNGHQVVPAARPFDPIQRPKGPLPAETKNPGLFRDQGSNVTTLVDLRGFEPLAPSMRTRCATGLRHRPLQRVKP